MADYIRTHPYAIGVPALGSAASGRSDRQQTHLRLCIKLQSASNCALHQNSFHNLSTSCTHSISLALAAPIHLVHGMHPNRHPSRTIQRAFPLLVTCLELLPRASVAPCFAVAPLLSNTPPPTNASDNLPDVDDQGCLGEGLLSAVGAANLLASVLGVRGAYPSQLRGATVSFLRIL